LAKHLGRRPLAGIHPAWNKDTAAACDLAGGSFFGFGRFLGESTRLFEIGLPIDYSARGASVVLLSDDNLMAFSKDEVRTMLSGGVFMDTQALARLNEMGFADLTGFDADRVVTIDCIERMTDHPLNRQFAGRERDCRQSFYHHAARTLKPRDPKAGVLTNVVDYAGDEVAPCVMGVFENRLGGRVCVAGYFPWTFLHSLSKSSQMKSVLRWLSKDRLPAYVDSFHKINLWVREPSRDGAAMAMTNSCLDAARDVALLIRTDRERVRVFDMTGAESHVRAGGSDGPYRKFVIPSIEPWHMCLVVADSRFDVEHGEPGAGRRTARGEFKRPVEINRLDEQVAPGEWAVPAAQATAEVAALPEERVERPAAPRADGLAVDREGLDLE
jgi:hypothetical protein